MRVDIEDGDLDTEYFAIHTKWSLDYWINKGILRAQQFIFQRDNDPKHTSKLANETPDVG